MHSEMHLMNIIGKRCISCSLRGCSVVADRADVAPMMRNRSTSFSLDWGSMICGWRIWSALCLRETRAANRLELARKLADAYSEELVSAAEEPERFAVLKSRVEKLLATIPDARTPAVDVILLQAEYQRAEALILHWIEEPDDKAALEQAAAVLSRIQPLLSARQTELADAADRAADRIDTIKNERERKAAEQQLAAATGRRRAGRLLCRLGGILSGREPTRRRCIARPTSTRPSSTFAACWM